MSNVLSVDEDQGTTKLLEYILSKEGYEALPTALLHNPNPIFHTILMPSMDGAIVHKDLSAELKSGINPSAIETTAGGFAAGFISKLTFHTDL
jgi:hypothetical protein